MTKFLQSLLAVAFFLLCAASTKAESPKAEFRSFWIATVWRLDWPGAYGTTNAIAENQKAEMTGLLDRLAAANFNAVCFQVRSMCDAIYDSKYEPWSAMVSGTRGKAPAYDPFEFIVAECHKRGMECHAWVNPMRFSTGSNYSTENDKFMRDNGWLLTHGSTTIMNPGIPEVRQRITDVCADIIEKYDVDGLLFDDYFYPPGIPEESSAGDYDLYKNSGASDFGDWRRENVNKVVVQIYEMIQEKKPYVRFGIAPRGIACTTQSMADKYGVPRCTSGSDSQYGSIFCEPLAWLKAGTIDYISPQIYWARGNKSGDFSVLCPWWSQVADKFGRHCYVSHSLEYFKNGEKKPATREKAFAGMAAQVQMNRDETLNNSPGSIFYSYSCVDGEVEKENGVDFFDYMKDAKFRHKAITPCINWKDAQPMPAVANLSLSGNLLSWDASGNVRYSVYVLPSGVKHSIEELTAERMVAHIYNNVYEFAVMPGDCEIAVAVVDRYGNEYEPAWLTVGVGGEASVANEPLEIVVAGSKVAFSAMVDEAEVLDLNGRTILKVSNAESLDLGGVSGAVIVRAKSAGCVVAKKIFMDL